MIGGDIGKPIYFGGVDAKIFWHLRIKAKVFRVWATIHRNLVDQLSVDEKSRNYLAFCQ